MHNFLLVLLQANLMQQITDSRFCPSKHVCLLVKYMMVLLVSAKLSDWSISPLQLPHLSETTANSTAVLRCGCSGFPLPVISWQQYSNRDAQWNNVEALNENVSEGKFELNSSLFIPARFSNFRRQFRCVCKDNYKNISSISTQFLFQGASTNSNYFIKLPPKSLNMIFENSAKTKF